MTHAQTEGLGENGDPGMPAEVPVPGDAAGKSSVTLAAHQGVPLAQIADTSNARRKNVFNGNHSTVDTVVFGLAVDDSKHADKRDFTGAAGNLSSTAALAMQMSRAWKLQAQTDMSTNIAMHVETDAVEFLFYNNWKSHRANSTPSSIHKENTS